MKVRTIKDVDLREGKPSTAAPKKGLIYKGFVIDGEPVKGESLGGNDQWYHDRNGDFIWGGCVEKITTNTGQPVTAKKNLPPGRIDWRTRVLNLPAEWTATGGAGIKVAVLDSGLDFGHPAFPHVVEVPNSNCSDDPSLRAQDTSSLSHGTHCTGFIGARAEADGGVIGVVPQATLLPCRVRNQDQNYKPRHIARGIKWALGQGAHVISISLTLGYATTELEKAVLQAVSGGVVVVASAGDNEDLDTPELLWPAEFPETIAVGAVDQDYVDSRGAQEHVLTLDYVLPLMPMWSCIRRVQGSYLEQMGSSMCTALVAGIIAGLLSYLGFTAGRPENYLDIVRSELDRLTVPLYGARIADSTQTTIMKPTYKLGGT